MTLLDKVYDFIEKYTKIDGDKIYRGWQNRMALPTTNEYIVYYVRDSVRHGTNVTEWHGEEEYVSNRVLREYTITIDVYDIDHERCLKYIQALETMSRSYEGISFFRQDGFYLQHADDFRSIPFTDSNNQYIYRYNMEIHISKWEQVDVNQEFAKEVKIEKFVDVTNPTTGKTERKNIIVNADEYLY